jgi:L-ascorbate metabolism protein UlaG (beta-lactamase superfamily)
MGKGLPAAPGGPRIRLEDKMTLSRRAALKIGATGLVSLVGGLGIRSASAQEMEGDVYPLAEGEIVIHPVSHASFVMKTPLWTIYVDPVGDAALYEGLPPPHMVLITHEHPDHFDAATLAAVIPGNVPLITNPAVYDLLPDDLRARATSMGNSDKATLEGGVLIEAVPAYNTTPDRLQYHPEGRDNGYVVTVGEQRVYIAGDTEDTPEMRALTDIFIAFLPMNLPYTMTVEQAADAVAAFAPQYVYPYHYNDSDLDAFEAMVTESGVATEVVRGDWYPAE